MDGQRVGHVRVSGLDQNPDRQLEAVSVARTFTDTASGRDIRRPELDWLLAFVREGDTVVVRSMDRLASTLDDLRHVSPPRFASTFEKNWKNRDGANAGRIRARESPKQFQRRSARRWRRGRPSAVPARTSPSA